MVAQLDAESMRIVVQGEHGRSCGPIGCYIVHLQRSTPKVETFMVEGPAEPVKPASNGYGGSWGRGAFKRVKTVQTEPMLRFDANKGKGMQPSYCQ